MFDVFMLNMFDYISCVSPIFITYMCIYRHWNDTSYYIANNSSLNFVYSYGTCVAAKSKQTLFLIVIKIIFWNKCYDQWTLSEQCILIKLTNCSFVGCELNYLHTCFTQSSYVLGCCSYLLFSLVSFCAMLLPIVIVVMQFLINYHTMNLYLNKCVQCMHSVYM